MAKLFRDRWRLGFYYFIILTLFFFRFAQTKLGTLEIESETIILTNKTKQKQEQKKRPTDPQKKNWKQGKTFGNK